MNIILQPVQRKSKCTYMSIRLSEKNSFHFSLNICASTDTKNNFNNDSTCTPHCTQGQSCSTNRQKGQFGLPLQTRKTCNKNFLCEEIFCLKPTQCWVKQSPVACYPPIFLRELKSNWGCVTHDPLLYFVYPNTGMTLSTILRSEMKPHSH